MFLVGAVPLALGSWVRRHRGRPFSEQTTSKGKTFQLKPPRCGRCPIAQPGLTHSVWRGVIRRAPHSLEYYQEKVPFTSFPVIQMRRSLDDRLLCLHQLYSLTHLPFKHRAGLELRCQRSWLTFNSVGSLLHFISRWPWFMECDMVYLKHMDG